ncbi:unnamed protein product, partial [Ectocarpus sp. 12 AP-2014]
MDAARADAYFTALMSPTLFNRQDGYLLFFSGGQGGRVSSSFQKWGHQDLEFNEMSVDQAKVCSHHRLELEGAMDMARERDVRELAESRCAPSDVTNFPLHPDSSDEDSVNIGHNTPPPPTARRQWGTIGRTAADTSTASADMPLIVPSQCVEPGCSMSGQLAMMSCNLCDGALHRGCGVRGGDDE